MGSGTGHEFFGFLIPSPFTRFPAALLHWIQTIHHWNAWLVVAIATGHGMAAVFHQVILKDGVLDRMMLHGDQRANPLFTQKP